MAQDVRNRGSFFDSLGRAVTPVFQGVGEFFGGKRRSPKAAERSTGAMKQSKSVGSYYKQIRDIDKMTSGK